MGAKRYRTIVADPPWIYEDGFVSYQPFARVSSSSLAGDSGNDERGK